MPTVPYATPAQLETYLPPNLTMPEDAQRLLERASDRVDDFVLAGFGLDPITQLPRDEKVAWALADATCAQVEFWLEVGEEHDVDGIRGDISVPGVAYPSPPTLAPRARSVLTRASLMNVGQVGT